MNNSISYNLKTLQMRSGLNQKDFARKYGIKESTFSAYMNSKAVPTIDTLIAICNGEGTNLDWLCSRKIRPEDESPFEDEESSVVTSELGNGWNLPTTKPVENGMYYVVLRCHIPNPEELPYLYVRNGDLVIDFDYYDIENRDWRDNPDRYKDDNCRWEVVAWKDITVPMPPAKYKSAGLVKDVIVGRSSYEDELKQTEVWF